MLVVFDIDGTLADCRHRLHYIKNKPKNWKKFMNEAFNDGLIEPTFKIYESLRDKNYTIILATGRNEAIRDITEQWLKRFDITYSALYMRADGDYRPDYETKKDMLDSIVLRYKRKPDMVFEDRPGVVNMWRENGIFVFDCDQA